MSVEASQLVACGRCGAAFELSARNVRAAHKRGEESVCWECRHPAKPLDERERARLHRWWVEESGLSLDELRELAWAVAETLPD